MPRRRSLAPTLCVLSACVPLASPAQQPGVTATNAASPRLAAAAALSAGAAPRPGAPALRPGAPDASTFVPTWETQKQARTYVLSIPAPRGQITDRNGEPLAVTRISYNLAIQFPTPLSMSDAQALAFAQQQIAAARILFPGRQLTLNSDQALKHYRNRGIVPYVIAQDLRPNELEAFHSRNPENLTLQPIYLRTYPNGGLAGHIIGYAGRSGKMPEGPIENNELLWPNAEGREGLEQTFDAQLQGKMGQYSIQFDATGKKVSEQITFPPQAGYNVVTTLDANIQRICEETLAKGLKRGAMVIVDPGSGDVLAMASWPTINPNMFVPAISTEQFKQLNDDPNIPLIPRAYRSAYPPGSTFKILVGLAAMQTRQIKPGDEFSCPPSMEIGNITFRNWKKTDAGHLNFVDALTQSCDTWFYQVGMKIGPRPIIDYAQQFGLGKKTGLPLIAEADGLVPSDDYMLRVHKRKILNGDVANLSIGQGDLLVTPLQMAEAMSTVGNGGTVFQTRLVQQVQSIDGQIVNAYGVKMNRQVDIDRDVLKNVKRGMINVVSSRMGTAGRAQVKDVEVAGKTGTAQWGPKNKERTAAWFSGFAPADDPKYAFAVVYEGDVNNDDVHGGTVAAPLVGKVLNELFKNDKPVKKKRGKHDDDDDDDNSGGNMHEDDEPAVKHVPRPTPPPPPPQPEKKSFWKRLFG